MNATGEHITDADRRLAEAAAWRLRLAEAGVESSTAFEAWLAADAANLDAWRKVDAPWALLGDHANSPAVVALRHEALERAKRQAKRLQNRQPIWRRIAAAALLLVALTSIGTAGGMWLSQQPQRYVTELGERRSIVLSDGSRISLDSGTEVRVRLSESARRLELRRGQARFDVAHDALRPFSVRAGDRSVIAVGTAFNIDLRGADVRVTLLEGRVRVLELADTPGESQPRAVREISLNAGQELVAAPSQQPVIESANISRAIAWERGQIDFADESVSNIAARVERYTRGRIIVNDPQVRAMRLSGVVNAGDAEDFTDLVTTYLPVDVVQRSNGDIELVQRRM